MTEEWFEVLATTKCVCCHETITGGNVVWYPGRGRPGEGELNKADLLTALLSHRCSMAHASLMASAAVLTGG